MQVHPGTPGELYVTRQVYTQLWSANVLFVKTGSAQKTRFEYTTTNVVSVEFSVEFSQYLLPRILKFFANSVHCVENNPNAVIMQVFTEKILSHNSPRTGTVLVTVSSLNS